jgi:ankyrin repeat protein
MSHGSSAGGAEPPSAAQGGGMAIAGAALDAAGVVHIVVSCPEQGSLNADGSAPYDQAVMTKLIELQDLGRVKIAFDRAGTSTASKDDEKKFRSAEILQQSGEWDTAKELILGTKWFQAYTGGVKKFLSAEAQGFDGTQVIICIDGGTVTQVEQQEMSRILAEATADAKKSGVVLRTRMQTMSYCEFLRRFAQPAAAPATAAPAAALGAPPAAEAPRAAVKTLAEFVAACGDIDSVEELLEDYSSAEEFAGLLEDYAALLKDKTKGPGRKQREKLLAEHAAGVQVSGGGGAAAVAAAAAEPEPQPDEPEPEPDTVALVREAAAALAAAEQARLEIEEVRAEAAREAEQTRLQEQRRAAAKADAAESLQRFNNADRAARLQRAKNFGQACKDGNLEAMREHVREGMDLNLIVELRDAVGQVWADTPLGWTVDGHQLEAAEFLLDHGADTNKLSGYGSAPLHLAAQQGQLSMVQLLVHRGASIALKAANGQDAIGWTQGEFHPLYDGATDTRDAVAQWLIQHQQTIVPAEQYHIEIREALVTAVERPITLVDFDGRWEKAASSVNPAAVVVVRDGLWGFEIADKRDMPITYDEGLRRFRTNDWVADLGGMPSRIVWTKHGTVGGGVDGEILVWTRLAGGGEQSVGGVAGSGAAPRARRTVVPGSAFHRMMFEACGKLPAVPTLSKLRPLLLDNRFSGCADDYVDENGSSLLMYCVGPANAETMPMVTLLIQHGACATHVNNRGETALAYVKAWRNQPEERNSVNIYDQIVAYLINAGCEASEPAAF